MKNERNKKEDKTQIEREGGGGDGGVCLASDRANTPLSHPGIGQSHARLGPIAPNTQKHEHNIGLRGRINRKRAGRENK